MSMLPRPHPDATPDRSSSLAIAGHAIDGRWILLVMAGVGFGAGLAVSWLVGGQIAVEPSQARSFYLCGGSIGALVGALTWGIAWFTLFDANRRLSRLASHDMLTGLANQAHFLQRVNEELARARRLDD